MRTLFCALFVLPILLAGGCGKDADTGKGTQRTPPQLTNPSGKDNASPQDGAPAAGGLPHAVPIKDGKAALSAENTQIKFVGTKPDGKHDGGFKTFTGTIEFNDKGDAPKGLTLEIDAASIYTDNTKLTGHLKSKDFFDVAKFPKATFNSTKIEPAGKGDKDATHRVAGNLTIRGQTKEISFSISLGISNNALVGNSTFEINRQDYGMTYGPGKVNDIVTVTVIVGMAGK